MAQGDGHCVGRVVRLGHSCQMEQPSRHVHHLAFFRLAVPHHSLLHLGGCVFIHGDPQLGCGHEDDASGLGHANAGGHIGVKKELLNGHDIRGKPLDQCLQIFMDLEQAPGHGDPCLGIDGPAPKQAGLSPLCL